MVADLSPQENIAKSRKEAQLYLQERGIWKIRIKYKRHWQDFEGQPIFKETEMTYGNGKTKKEPTPPKINELIHRILSEYHPEWEKGSRGLVEWNLEDDRLAIRYEEEGEPSKEEVSCEKIYGREDPAVREFLEVQKMWMAGLKQDTEKTKLFYTIRLGYRIDQYGERETVIEYGLRTVSRNGSSEELRTLRNELQQNDQERRTRIVAYKIYQVAEKNAEQDKRPLVESQDLERVIVEATRESEVMIKSIHTFNKKLEVLKPHIFVITPNGKKAKIQMEEPTPAQITSRIIWIIPVIITALTFVPLLFGPWIWPHYFGQHVNLTATFPIATTAILAWIRLVIRQKTWKETLKKRTRRLAGVPEHPNAQMDKPNRFLKREWMYLKDYFNFVRTFTERRRGNVIAIEEAARTEKEHDHATATMRKQEEANAVAFLRANYTKHEKGG